MQGADAITPTSIWKHSFSIAMIAALGTSIVSCFFYLMDWTDVANAEIHPAQRILNSILFISCIAVAIQQWKTASSYKLSLGVGFKVGFTTALIYSLFNALWVVVFFKIIAPDMMGQIVDNTLANASSSNADAEKLIKKLVSLPFLLIIAVCRHLIGGAILAFIIAAILKTSNNQF